MREHSVKKNGYIQLQLEYLHTPAPDDLNFTFHPDVDMLYLSDWRDKGFWSNYNHLYQSLEDFGVLDRLTNLAVGVQHLVSPILVALLKSERQ